MVKKEKSQANQSQGKNEEDQDEGTLAGKRDAANRNKVEWTESEDKALFKSYKALGAKWAAIAQLIPEKTENQVKNRFYSTLRRVATKKTQAFPVKEVLNKSTLLKYVDDALDYGHNCCSKRGRKKKKIMATQSNPEDKVLFSPFADIATKFKAVTKQLPCLPSVMQCNLKTMCTASQNALRFNSTIPHNTYVPSAPMVPQANTQMMFYPQNFSLPVPSAFFNPSPRLFPLQNRYATNATSQQFLQPASFMGMRPIIMPVSNRYGTS